jgi:hypothetical protein
MHYFCGYLGETNVIGYFALRLVLWAATVIIALFPTLQAAGAWPSLNPFLTMAAVNMHGNFRDLLFVMVPAAALALSTWMEFLSACVIRRRAIRTGLITVGFLALIAIVTNIVILATGMVGFSLIPVGTGQVAPDTFSYCSNAILAGLGVSLFSEIGATFANTFYGHYEPGL